MLHRLLLTLAVLALVLGSTAAPTAAEAPRVALTLEAGGQVVIELFPQEAPGHVANLLKLARQGFYDGQRVHRVAPGFVVQLGDPQSKTLPLDHPDMGTGGPGYTIRAEFNRIPFDRGVVGMARLESDPDSAGSQFYIVLKAAHFLNGRYTAFGRVVQGMDVVDRIRVGDRVTSVRVVDR